LDAVCKILGKLCLPTSRGAVSAAFMSFTISTSQGFLLYSRKPFRESPDSVEELKT
jgi:hypothetical protein